MEGVVVEVVDVADFLAEGFLHFGAEAELEGDVVEVHPGLVGGSELYRNVLLVLCNLWRAQCGEMLTYPGTEHRLCHEINVPVVVVLCEFGHHPCECELCPEVSNGE